MAQGVGSQGSGGREGVQIVNFKLQIANRATKLLPGATSNFLFVSGLLSSDLYNYVTDNIHADC